MRDLRNGDITTAAPGDGVLIHHHDFRASQGESQSGRASDAAGRACLAAMHRQGAEFIASDCLMKATVAEITQTPGPDRGRPK